MTQRELPSDDEMAFDVPDGWRPVLWGAAQIIHSESQVEIAQNRVLEKGTTGILVVDHGDGRWGFRPDDSNGAISVKESELGPVQENEE